MVAQKWLEPLFSVVLVHVDVCHRRWLSPNTVEEEESLLITQAKNPSITEGVTPLHSHLNSAEHQRGYALSYTCRWLDSQ